MLFNKSKQVDDIKHRSTNIVAVYHLSALVWQNSNSCFGRGYWNANAPWSDTEGWKD